jgi:CheY-like chemotaxis protein
MNNLGRILLVEDSENDIELTLDALKENKLANLIDVARDGVEAIDYLYRQNKFSGREIVNPILILLDIKLPKLDGKDVLKKIKSDDKLKNIPVVMLTSSKEEQDIIDSYFLGVNAYVVKPVEFNKFIEAVRQIGIFWALVNQPPLLPS